MLLVAVGKEPDLDPVLEIYVMEMIDRKNHATLKPVPFQFRKFGWIGLFGLLVVQLVAEGQGKDFDLVLEFLVRGKIDKKSNATLGNVLEFGRIGPLGLIVVLLVEEGNGKGLESVLELIVLEKVEHQDDV